MAGNVISLATISQLAIRCCNLAAHVLRTVLFKLFSCVALSQYKTYTYHRHDTKRTRTTILIQNMYTYHRHNTKHVRVPLGTANINAYSQDTSLLGTSKKQWCGNLKFRSSYLDNLMQIDQRRVCTYTQTVEQYLVKVKIKQYLQRPGQALRFSGG